MSHSPSHEDNKTSDDDESLLVARTRQGNSAAFTVLVTRYLDDVTRFAFYITGSRDIADDVAQSVFISLWNHRATLDPSRPLKPYLFRAVRNRALNERKATTVRERYRAGVQAEIASGSVSAAAPSPEDAIVSLATINAVIDRFPEPRRLALRLRLIDELTHVEIAEVLGLSHAAARQLVHRAITDLKKILDVSH
jgi:RNA polymerase sigma-70 factor (ECF subfamily)